MDHPAPKLPWQERVIQTYNYHCDLLKTCGDNWRIKDTAKKLNRSYGSVAEDIMLADWMRSHEEIKAISFIKDALIFVKTKKKKLKYRKFN